MERKKKTKIFDAKWAGQSRTLLLSVLGILLLCYPFVSKYWNRYRAQQLVTQYEEKNETAPVSLLKESRYNQSLVGKSYFQDVARDENSEYYHLLNPAGNGMMGSLEIPCIQLTLPIYHYADEISLEKGVGHLPGSSLPIGGTSTNTVLLGHRGLPNQTLFSDLDKLSVGDTFYLHILGRTMTYCVDNILTIAPDETEELHIAEQMDYCTLLTCTPYGVNSHRLLVRGVRSEDTPVTEPSAAEPVRKHAILPYVCCVLLGILLALLYDKLITLLRRSPHDS
ncbi:MAG: class C sortase [Oscillospiraceae bacterium]|nr:class C sortase [Oscillospiraceae bacterium]